MEAYESNAMSQSSRLDRRPPGDAAPDRQAVDLPPSDLLELLDDEYARAILEHTAEEARSARELVSTLSASRATVYRRLNRLEDAGLVEHRTRYDPDGHHRKTFRATLDSVTVSLDGELRTEVTLVADADRRAD